MRRNESTHTPTTIACDWAKLEFSNDGKPLLVGTNRPGHFLLDAFSGDLKGFCGRRRCQICCRLVFLSSTFVLATIEPPLQT